MADGCDRPDSAVARGRPALGAAVARELLRTPAFRELLRVNLRGDWEASAPELAGALLTEDVEVGLALASAAPRAVNALLRALAEAGRAADRVPGELLRSYAEQLVQELDGEALADALAVHLGLLRRLLLEDERTRVALLGWLAARTNALARRLVAALQDREATAQTRVTPAKRPPGSPELLRDVAVHLARGLDFGLLRRAVELLCAEALRLAAPLLDELLGDPVLLANLLGTAPPLVNAAVGLAARVLAAIKLPPEVLASGVFNLLREVDAGQLAALANGIGRTIQSLHTGSLLLGRHEPRLRAVLAGLLEELLPRLDRAMAAAALVALAEDLETVLRVLADAAVRDPQLLHQVTAGAVDCAAAVSRGVAGALEALERLPDAALDGLAAELARGAAPKMTAHAVNAGARLAERLLARRAALSAERVAPFWATLDHKRLLALGARLTAPLRDAAREALARLDPAQLAPLLAAALELYGAALAHRPRLLSDAVAAVDPALTARAVELTGQQLELLLREQPQLLQPLLQPLISRLPRLLLDHLRALLFGPTSGVAR